MNPGSRRVSRSALHNIIRHTDVHNRLVEEEECWRQYSRKNSEGFGGEARFESQPHQGRRGSSPLHRTVYRTGGPSTYMDRPDETRARVYEGRDGRAQDRYWTNELYKAEEGDPNRWGHSGYKELYPEEFQEKQVRETGGDRSNKKKGKERRSSSRDNRHRKKSGKKHKKKRYERSSSSSSSDRDDEKSPQLHRVKRKHRRDNSVKINKNIDKNRKRKRGSDSSSNFSDSDTGAKKPRHEKSPQLWQSELDVDRHTRKIKCEVRCSKLEDDNWHKTQTKYHKNESEIENRKGKNKYDSKTEQSDLQSDENKASRRKSKQGKKSHKVTKEGSESDKSISVIKRSSGRKRDGNDSDIDAASVTFEFDDDMVTVGIENNDNADSDSKSIRNKQLCNSDTQAHSTGSYSPELSKYDVKSKQHSNIRNQSSFLDSPEVDAKRTVLLGNRSREGSELKISRAVDRGKRSQVKVTRVENFSSILSNVNSSHSSMSPSPKRKDTTQKHTHPDMDDAKLVKVTVFCGGKDDQGGRRSSSKTSSARCSRSHSGSEMDTAGKTSAAPKVEVIQGQVIGYVRKDLEGSILPKVELDRKSCTKDHEEESSPKTGRKVRPELELRQKYVVVNTPNNGKVKGEVQSGASKEKLLQREPSRENSAAKYRSAEVIMKESETHFRKSVEILRGNSMAKGDGSSGVKIEKPDCIKSSNPSTKAKELVYENVNKDLKAVFSPVDVVREISKSSMNKQKYSDVEPSNSDFLSSSDEREQNIHPGLKMKMCGGDKNSPNALPVESRRDERVNKDKSKSDIDQLLIQKLKELESEESDQDNAGEISRKGNKELSTSSSNENLKIRQGENIGKRELDVRQSVRRHSDGLSEMLAATPGDCQSLMVRLGNKIDTKLQDIDRMQDAKSGLQNSIHKTNAMKASYLGMKVHKVIGSRQNGHLVNNDTKVSDRLMRSSRNSSSCSSSSISSYDNDSTVEDDKGNDADVDDDDNNVKNRGSRRKIY